MSLSRSIADFLTLEQGGTGARRLLQTSAVAVAVLAASSSVVQGWYNGGCDYGVPHDENYDLLHTDGHEDHNNYIHDHTCL